MKYVTVITKEILFTSRNGRGFLLPIIRNIKNFEKIGIKIKIQYSISAPKDPTADIIVLDSQGINKIIKNDETRIKPFIEKLRSKAKKIIFFDLNDDTGSNFYFTLIPYVDKYCKAYVYKNKDLYKREFYGGRLWTDFYHRKYGIKDTFFYPNHLVSKEDDLKKIQTGYLSGLVDCTSKWSFKTNGKLLAIMAKAGVFKIYKGIPSGKNFAIPSINRTNPVSCRITTSYTKQRETITYQREIVAKKLEKFLSINLLSRKNYLQELKNSKIVISPFGWGEINNARDYEVAINGSVLMKPDISHLKTYPNIFNKETAIQFRWDLSDLTDKIDDILRNYDDYIENAKKLQQQYKYYLCSEKGNYAFCNHVKDLFLK